MNDPVQADQSITASNQQSRWWLAMLISGLLAVAATLALIALRPSEAVNGDCAQPTHALMDKNALIAVDVQRFRLGKALCVGVNLPEYFKEERAVPRSGTAPRVVTLQLFFNRHATPATFEVDIDAPGNVATAGWVGWEWVKVPLRPAASADGALGRQWRELLTQDDIEPVRKIDIGIAVKPTDGEAKLPRSGPAAIAHAELTVFNPVLTVLGVFGLALIATGIVRACWYTGLLRDGLPCAENAFDPPFSLGRVQMAFWLLLSFGGFAAIWLITGAYTGVITKGVLTLLGISGMSGIAARLIDVNDPTPVTMKSAGFWRDIASEGYGVTRSVAVHRLQMLAWTVALGVVFAWTVFTSFSFPDFDPNLLLLMGISSGTYLGFKLPEKKAAETALDQVTLPQSAPKP